MLDETENALVQRAKDPAKGCNISQWTSMAWINKSKQYNLGMVRKNGVNDKKNGRGKRDNITQFAITSRSLNSLH